MPGGCGNTAIPPGTDKSRHKLYLGLQGMDISIKFPGRRGSEPGLPLLADTGNKRIYSKKLPAPLLSKYWDFFGIN